MNPLSTALTVTNAVLATAIVIQGGALFYFFRKLQRLKEICEEAIVTNTSLKDDIDSLRGRLKYIEAQQQPKPTVTFDPSLTPHGDYNTPLSRVASIGSSIAFEDAQEDWPDETTAFLPSSQPNGTFVKEQTVFTAIDALHEEGDPQQCYDKLKPMVTSEPKNVEVLWRFARACHGVGQQHEQKSHKRHELIKEGHKHAFVAYKIDEKNFNVVKWTAVLTGALTDFLGTKERIQQGFHFKEYLDKGLAIDPKEYSLLHMRGRFSFSVANLSWLERKAAATFFASPPTATIDEALADFLEVEKIKPEWIENLLFTARSYQAKGDKEKARHYLNKIIHIHATDDAEKESQEEARKLLKNL